MHSKFKVRAEKLKSHLYDIEMYIEAKWDNVILEMPSWTPGSYLIREFVRHVQNLTATLNGESLGVYKTTKNRFQIQCKKSDQILIKFEVYAFQLTVRTSYLDDRKGLITPANLFFYQVDPVSQINDKLSKIYLTFELPDGWEQYSCLRADKDLFFVDNFDELVDTPIALGGEDVIEVFDYTFESNGISIPNKVVIIGDKYQQDIEKFANDLKKLQNECIRMFDELPYDRYVWLLYITNKSGGGLEHKFSNCSIIPRWNFTDPDKYVKLVSLEAHEHFHAYNIKRIRPKQLGPFDYSAEVYTKLLWVAEGLTSFYDNIMLPRSNLIFQEKYWEIIAEDLKTLYGSYGRFIKSVEDSSFDSWIKFYRPDENSSNSSISYYLKGGLIGLMLDLEIRKQTNGVHSLDTFYKYMYEEYKRNPEVGYEEEDLQTHMENATSTNLAEFWTKYIKGTDEIDIEGYLSLIGMKINNIDSKTPYTGINFKLGLKIVSKVDFDSPAMKAGIFANDRIVAIESFEAKDNFDTILNDSQNKEIEIHLFRDGKLLQYSLTPTAPVVDKIEIVPKEDPTQEELELKKQFFIGFIERQ